MSAVFTILGLVLIAAAVLACSAPARFDGEGPR